MVIVRGGEVGVRALLATVMRLGFATALVNATVNGPVPVTDTLPVPTLRRAFSAFWMLVARVLPLLFQAMLPVVRPLNESRKVPPVMPLPSVIVCVGASTVRSMGTPSAGL